MEQLLQLSKEELAKQLLEMKALYDKSQKKEEVVDKQYEQVQQEQQEQPKKQVKQVKKVKSKKLQKSQPKKDKGSYNLDKLFKDPKFKYKQVRYSKTKKYNHTPKNYGKTYEEVEELQKHRRLINSDDKDYVKIAIGDYEQVYKLQLSDQMIERAQIKVFTVVYDKENEQDKQKHFTIRLKNISKEQLENEDFIKNIVKDYFDQYEYLDLKEITKMDIYNVSEQVDIYDIPLKQSRYLKDRLLGDLNVVFKNIDQCVIDYIKYELSSINKDQARLNKFNTTNLLKILNMKKVDDGCTIRQFMNIVNHFPVKVYVFDMFGSLIAKDTSNDNSRKTLIFYVNNNHVYPILKENLKKSIVKQNQIDFMQNTSQFSVDPELKYQFIEYYDLEKAANQEFDVISKTSERILIDERNDFLQICHQVIEQTESIPHLKMRNGAVVAFQHPETKQIYESTSKYNERKQLLECLEGEFKLPVFKFENQSYTQIGKQLYNYVFGELDQMQSYLTIDQYDIFDQYPIKPYIHLINNHSQNQQQFMFDIVKSYSNAVYNSQDDFNIFSRYDDVRPFKYNKKKGLMNGEYYIDCQIKLSETIILPNGWYPQNMVYYAINNDYITIKNIKYQLIASKTIKKDSFKEFVEYLYKNYPSDAKMIVNCLIGDFGTKYLKKDLVNITTSYEMLLAMIQIQEEKGFDVTFDCFNYNEEQKLYYIKSAERKKKLMNSYLPIYRQVMAQGIIQLHQLSQQVLLDNPKCKVICYNTDSMTIQLPEKESINGQYLSRQEVDQADTLDIIGKFQLEDDYKIKGHKLIKELVSQPEYKYQPMKWTYVKEDSEDLQKILESQSCVINGIGGSGKTQLIKRNYNPQTDQCVCPTNAAVQNIKSRIDQVSVETLDSFFNPFAKKDDQESKFEQIKRLWIDEYTMVSKNMMNKLYKLKQKYNLQLIFTGDPSQIPPIADLQYKQYHTTNFFNDLCDGNRYIVQYKEKYARYNKTKKEYLDYLLKNSQIHPDLKNKKIRPELERNISWSRKVTMKNINEKFFKSHKNKYYEGQRLYGNNNQPKKNIYNNQEYIITKVEGSNITVKDLTLFKEEILSKKCIETNFELGYCNTIFCVQGLTIEEDYNIYDLEKMNINEVYTAMSRCKDISKVHFNYTDKVFKIYAYFDQIEVEMKSNILEENKYKSGKIYKILLKEETRRQQLIYVGQSINAIEKRLSEHINDRFNLNDQFHQFLRSLSKERLGKISIELVEDYPCKSNMVLLQREAYWIQKLNPEYNTYMRFVPKQIEEQQIKEQVIREDKDLIKISVIEDKQYILVYGKLGDKSIKTKVRFGARKTQKEALDTAIDMKQQFINDYLTNGTISTKKSSNISDD